MEDKKYIGIDVGGSAVKTGLVDGSGKVLAKSETLIDLSCENERVIDTAIRSVKELVEEHDIDLAGIGGIGVSAPGSIDTVKGEVAIGEGNVPNWSGTKVREILEGEFGLPVSLANDGNCVALAEAWIGAGCGCPNVICVVLGTGIGGGIISGGHLIEGARGFAGEIGHFPTHAGGIKCNCGCVGCYEKYAATSALVAKSSSVDPKWSNGRALFDDANAGDKKALEIVDAWTDEVASGIAGLVHIFNPQIVLIGGGVSAQEELVVEPIRRKVNALLIPDFADGLTIKRAELGNDAGMVGAVKHLIDAQNSGRIRNM